MLKEQRFGDWVYNATQPVSIDYVGGFYKSAPYQIEVSRIFDEGIQSWLGHLETKLWFNPDCCANFIKILDYVVENQSSVSKSY